MLCLIALTAVVQGCGGECLDAPSAPARLAFDDAVLGERTLQVVRVSNTCGDDLAVSSVTVSGDEAFELDSGADSVPGEGEAPLAVAFTTDDYRQHVAELVLESANGPTTIVLTGAADPDQDGDGVDAFEAGGTDCDDTDADITEARDEEVNGRDDDCDGLVDEDFIEAGDIVMTELMLTPAAVTGRAGQWVEVKNQGRRLVDLRGWTLSGPSGRYVVQDSVRLSGGDTAVLGFEADTSLNGGVELDGVLDGSAEALPTQGWFLTLAVDGRAINVLSDKKWPEEAGKAIGLDPTIIDPAEATRAEFWCTASTALESGDYGTPGEANDYCPQFDHDGDGLSVDDGDCDDTNSDISPIAADVWDGLDNNCDGVVDLMSGLGAADGLIQGDRDAMGTDVGWTSDSLLLVGSGNQSSRLHVVAFGDALTEGAIANAADIDTGSLSESGSGRAGAITGTTPLYDIDDDGDEDLIVLGRPANYYQETTTYDYLWVYEDLPDDPDNAGGNDDAILVVKDPLDGNGSDGVQALLDVDLDGDGSIDTVFGHGSYKGTIEGFDRVNKGRVWILDLQEQSGRVDVDDLVVASWIGEEDFTGIGDAIEGGDLDEDGYDDVIVMDLDPQGDMEGSRRVQVIPGGVDLPADTTVEAVSPLTISGLALREGFGTSDIQAPLLADLDEDGEVDLAVPDPYANSVRIFHDASTLSGELDATDADLTLTGPGGFGTHLTTGDPKGDGSLHLLVGAPTNDSRDGQGRAFLFASTELGATGTVDSSASWAAFGVSDSSGFGQLAYLVDVNADGRDDVIVSDPSGFGFNGGVYLFLAPE